MGLNSNRHRNLGASLVEYLAVVALIAVVGIASVMFFGDEVCCSIAVNGFNISNDTHVQCRRRIDGSSNCPDDMTWVCTPIVDSCPNSDFEVCGCQ